MNSVIKCNYSKELYLSTRLYFLHFFFHCNSTLPSIMIIYKACIRWDFVHSLHLWISKNSVFHRRWIKQKSKNAWNSPKFVYKICMDSSLLFHPHNTILLFSAEIRKHKWAHIKLKLCYFHHPILWFMTIPSISIKLFIISIL
jgi:hypothetical protein